MTTDDPAKTAPISVSTDAGKTSRLSGSGSAKETSRIVSVFRVLHVEPSIEASLHLRSEMRRHGFHFTIERAGTYETVQEFLETGKWDLVVSEALLPMMNVEMILAQITTRKLDLPLIVLTDLADDRTLVDTMRAGARDYLLKSNLPAFLTAVERELQELDMRRHSPAPEGDAPKQSPLIQVPLKISENVDPVLCGCETILLADDDPSFREFMNWSLRRHGYHVIQATDGEEAEYILEHYIEKIHGMISDVIMPNLDGLELARRVVFLNPDIKVIMVSGYNDRPLERGHKIAGRYPLVWKPFEIATVLGMLRRQLDGLPIESTSDQG